ncbi:MAG: GTP 3',8-cyclase MoaA [Candidatus Marinimicrobia bacterium]|nr:GTP 3',8-cyclase MoaA [Candidatus Neomarinimicrobiota bacterium]
MQRRNRFCHSYDMMSNDMTQPQLQTSTPAASHGQTGQPLVDRFGRTFDYLRLAIIERCNLRCIYCMPEQGIDFVPQAELLSVEEMNRLIRVIAGAGVSKVRFTGGEPLMHPEILPLVSAAAGTAGIASVHVTTNGLLLKDMAADLKQAGLSGINISLDTLREDRFAQIARRPRLADALAGLEAALSVGFAAVKINVVALRGFNEDEVVDFAEMTREANITVRFIELMPFDAHQIWKTGTFLRLDTILHRLEETYGRLPEAAGSATESSVYRLPGHLGKVALIPAYTRTLCSSCNRIRITADGKIRNCLYAHNEFDLLSLLRSGADDGEILSLLRRAMLGKLKDGWQAQEAPGVNGQERDRSSMTQIGG